MPHMTRTRPLLAFACLALAAPPRCRRLRDGRRPLELRRGARGR
ncbi:MAG: hypothetical protein R3D59_17965 [Paracoccaceae bacterium]